MELVLHSAIVTDFAMARATCLPFSRPESRICFKVEAVTRTERASQGKNRNSSVTGHTNGVAPSIGEKSIHRLLLNSSIWSYPVAFELVLHSAIVTDFAMERVPDSHLGRPESRICFKVEAVTRTERASQGKNRNSSVTGHTNGVAPSIGEKSIHRLLLNSSIWSYPVALELVLHSAIVTDFAMERLPESL